MTNIYVGIDIAKHQLDLAVWGCPQEDDRLAHAVLPSLTSGQLRAGTCISFQRVYRHSQSASMWFQT